MNFQLKNQPPAKTRSPYGRVVPRVRSFDISTGRHGRSMANAVKKASPAAVKKLRKRNLAKISKKYWLAAAVVICLAIAAVAFLPRQHPTDSGQTDVPAAGSTGFKYNLTQGDPDYKTLLPAGKSIEELGGWTRISPPDRNPAYVYADKIGGVVIRVNEQPLPKSFKADTANRLAQLAHDFNADEKISINGTTVYIETSSNGSQYVILSKANLLVLINSVATISADKWIAYINSLH